MTGIIDFFLYLSLTPLERKYTKDQNYQEQSKVDIIAGYQLVQTFVLDNTDAFDQRDLTITWFFAFETLLFASARTLFTSWVMTSLTDS